MENKNSFTENLIRAIRIKNHNGLLVEFLRDGKVVWSGKEFENLKVLDGYLEGLNKYFVTSVRQDSIGIGDAPFKKINSI